LGLPALLVTGRAHSRRLGRSGPWAALEPAGISAQCNGRALRLYLIKRRGQPSKVGSDAFTAEFGGERIPLNFVPFGTSTTLYPVLQHCVMPANRRSPSRFVADPLPTDDLAIEHRREHKDRAAQDQKFIAAMIAAIRAGTERPHRVGIDTTPGTRAPRMIHRANVRRLDI
jgi:hypothetical protein